ncbi:hypothetical protein D3C75_1016060 [compost metagenome]|nr:hypothetical protein PS843_03506 [Pseudomonas fluorescens]
MARASKIHIALLTNEDECTKAKYVEDFSLAGSLAGSSVIGSDLLGEMAGESAGEYLHETIEQ